MRIGLENESEYSKSPVLLPATVFCYNIISKAPDAPEQLSTLLRAPTSLATQPEHHQSNVRKGEIKWLFGKQAT